MNSFSIRSRHPAFGASRRTAAAIGLVALLAMLGLVLFAAMRSPMKDDVAWLLYVARRWLAGQRLYIDVVEVNPPLIIWISAVPATVAGWLGVTSKMVAVPFFATLVLASAWWSASALRGAGALFEQRLPVFAAIGIVLLAVPGAEIGQREHLLVAAALPYLILLARSLEGAPPTLVPAIMAGLVAGLGCALKPRYGLAFAAVEILALARGQRILRPMTLGAVCVVATYVGAVLLLYPAYLERAVPLALALYGATDVTLQQLFYDSLRLLFGEAVLLLLLVSAYRRGLPERSLLTVLATFAMAATLVCFIDGKPWFYHRLPGTVVTLLALLLWLAASAAAPSRFSRSSWLLVLLAASACGVFAIGVGQRLTPHIELAIDPDLSTEARLVRLIVKEKARTYVAFSEWIALGFPVVNNTGVIWASRFDSMWALKGELWRARTDPGIARLWPIRKWVAQDFVAGCPDLVVVDMRGGLNYVAILGATEPAFAQAWTHYRPIATFDGLHVYRRMSAGCNSPLLSVSR